MDDISGVAAAAKQKEMAGKATAVRAVQGAKKVEGGVNVDQMLADKKKAEREAEDKKYNEMPESARGSDYWQWKDRRAKEAKDEAEASHGPAEEKAEAKPAPAPTPAATPKKKVNQYKPSTPF